ncbi:MAG: winged helix-turn-helix domain-containing protein [Caldimonas sp.]
MFVPVDTMTTLGGESSEPPHLRRQTATTRRPPRTLGRSGESGGAWRLLGWHTDVDDVGRRWPRTQFEVRAAASKIRATTPDATMNRRIPADVLPIEAVARAVRFAGFEFDLLRSELKGADGAPITLRPKAEVLLRHFLTDPGRLFAREELMDALWPAAVVTDDSLVQCVGELRAALGDRNQALIRTVPKRGYRFEASVVSVQPNVLSPPPLKAADAVTQTPTDALPTSPARTRGRGGRASLATIAVAVAIALVWAIAPGSMAPMSLDERITSRHVFAVMPLFVQSDESSLRDVAAHVGDEIAAHIAAQGPSRAFGRTRTASFDNLSPALERLASELHATYAITGRVRPAATGATLDVLVLTVPQGVSLGTASFDVGTSAAAPTAAEVGQLVANFVRGKVGELEYRRAIAPGHIPDAADLTTIGWEEVHRMSSPDDVVRARSRFREALRQDPESRVALLGLSASFVTGKSLRLPLTNEEATEFERTLDRLMKTAPNDSTAALLWADLMLQEGRPDLALPSIEKAVRLDPQYANAHLMLAVALIRVGRLDDAGPELDRAIRLATLSNDQRRVSTAYAAAAEIALARGEDVRAAELARQAIAMRPSSPRGATPYAILAAAEALSGRVADANSDMAIYRQRAPQATVATFDSTRPSQHPAFVQQRARLYEGLRLAGLPEH